MLSSSTELLGRINARKFDLSGRETPGMRSFAAAARPASSLFPLNFFVASPSVPLRPSTLFFCSLHAQLAFSKQWTRKICARIEDVASSALCFSVNCQLCTASAVCSSATIGSEVSKISFGKQQGLNYKYSQAQSISHPTFNHLP